MHTQPLPLPHGTHFLQKLLYVILVLSMIAMAVHSTPNNNCPSNRLTLIQQEAAYILSCQFMDPNNEAYGAINDVQGNPTWVVPREMALAVLALLKAQKCLNNQSYLQRSLLAADYLLKVQQADGSWADQYNYMRVAVASKSPTQTSEVVIMLARIIAVLAPNQNNHRFKILAYWNSIQRGLNFLNKLRSVANKTGNDDGLICGGLKADGRSYETWRWSSDNSFTYQAFTNAAHLAINYFGNAKEGQFYTTCANQILSGINRYLKNPNTAVWYQAVDNQGNNYVQSSNWINYSPAMLNVPATGADSQQVGTWIANTLLDQSTGAVFQDTDPKGTGKNYLSPGFSFQASFVWHNLGQTGYVTRALAWVERSGLRLTSGGFGYVDWLDKTSATVCPSWQRFIDTSFYAIVAYTGGYDFSPSSITISNTFW